MRPSFNILGNNPIADVASLYQEAYDVLLPLSVCMILAAIGDQCLSPLLNL